MKHYEREYDQRTIGSILEDKAKLNRDKIFLLFRDEKISYQEMHDNSSRVANGFLSLGIKKGDKVSVMLNNCPEYLYSWFGLAKIGAVDSPTNTSYKGDGLRHLITNSDAKALVVDESYVDRIERIQDELPALEKVIIYSPEGNDLKTNLKFPTYSFTELLDQSPDFTPPEKVESRDPLHIIYTSGTTGPSKGVVLTHNCFYLYSTDIIKFVGYREDDIVYNFFPLYHANHRFTSLLTLLNNATYAMGEGFSASRFWDNIKKHKATVAHYLGGILHFVNAQPPKEDDADNPVRLFFGGPVPRDIWSDFENRFNTKITCGYFGLSECSGVTWMTTEEQDRLKTEGKLDQAASCGRANKEIYDVRVLDEYDNEMPVGEVGEIVCRPSRPYSMISEYINMPEKTLEAFRNFYFHTGDLGKFDSDGYLYFVDRAKDYLRRRGENISSFEVEKVINSHPKIVESAAIAVKSEVGEDELKIVVKLKPGEELPPEELLDYSQERMAYYMVPRYVEFRDLPRTPTDKIEKYRLRADAINKKTWDREEAGYKVKK